MNKPVKEKFNSYPDNVKPKMLNLRKLIYEVAESAEGVGELEETLKWGEPAYITSKPKSGTTIRIDWKSKNPDQYALYVNCQTTLIAEYKAMFDDKLNYEGSRAIIIPVDKPLPEKELRICIALALRYHLDKKS